MLEILKDKFPDSIPYWGEYLEDEELRELTVSALTNFAYYVLALIQKDDLAEIIKVLDYMEFLLCNGDQGVKNSVATGFLELLENESFDNEKVRKSLSLLGNECKAYLKAWDDFWKTRK